MSPEEALRLCRMAKSLSPAQAVDEFTPAAWSLVLKNVRLSDAEEALAQLGGEQEWIHVSHIVQRVRRIRRDRVLDYGTLPDPPSSLDPDDTGAHAKWLRETTEAIADGTYRPPAPEALGAKREVIRELGQVKSVDAALAARAAREAHAEARRELQAADAERKREREQQQRRREEVLAADRAAREGSDA